MTPIPVEVHLSYFHTFLLFYESDDLAKVINDCLKLNDGFTGEFLWIGQIGIIFQRFVLEPSDIELVTSLLDFLQREAAKTSGVSPIGSFALPVRFLAVSFLEFGKMLRSQRAVLLGDSGDVGAG